MSLSLGDVVKGIVASLETSAASGKNADGSKPPFRVFNLGNKTPVTVSDFVSTLEKHLVWGGKTWHQCINIARTHTGTIMSKHGE